MAAKKYPPGVSVTVENDYDGWFERILREALWKKFNSGAKLKHSQFIITAGGYRMHDVSWEEEPTDRGSLVLHVDFYSVARMHGGPDLSSIAEFVAAL